MEAPPILSTTLISIAFLVFTSFLPLCLCIRTTRSGSYGVAESALFPNGTGITRADFPQDFLFGAITSSMKHEGAEFIDNKSDNIWDVYARREDASMDGSIPGQCGDNYVQYKNDHQLLLDMGMNSYRLSIAWSRIFPNGSGDVNEVAIAHYNAVIDDVLEKGLVPMVSLWTQDHPQILDLRYGGALNEQFIEDFANYAETCFAAFGDRVQYWITFDEANDWAGLGYSTNQNPPGRCTANIVGQLNLNYGNCPEGDSGTEPYIAGHNLLLAHAEAVSIYRDKYQPTQNGTVGLGIWFRWSEPLTNSTEDVEAAQRATDFLVGWFLDPIFFGDYPQSMRENVGSRLPNFTEEQIAKVKGSLDFIGVNFLTAFYAYDFDFSTIDDRLSYYLDWKVNVTGIRDGEYIGKGEHDYAVPWSLRKTIEYVKDRYDNFPQFLTQTGWGMAYNYTEGFDEQATQETLDDDERVEFFQTYYDELAAAIREGANVKGAYAWSLIDGFEFNLGMGIRVGLYYVDKDLNRHPRKSAQWFKEMLAQNNIALA